MQKRCTVSGCRNFITTRAAAHGAEQCKVCRRESGILVDRCTFKYENGRKCYERNHEYHFHCPEANCNGEVYCELCMQCPNCNPCH